MPVQRYRKLPVVIEAFEFTGDNVRELYGFSEGKVYQTGRDHSLVIRTLEGEMRVSSGDFVIRGVNGEFYPCKPDIFWKTYERAE